MFARLSLFTSLLLSVSQSALPLEPEISSSLSLSFFSLEAPLDLNLLPQESAQLASLACLAVTRRETLKSESERESGHVT